MNKKQKVGIHNKGKRNRFINNTVKGADVGMLDEGEDTFAKGNEFYGVEKYAKDVKDLPLWLKYAVAFATIFATFFGGWGLYIVLSSEEQTSEKNNLLSKIATSTVSISDIFARYNDMDRAIDQQSFLKEYIDQGVYGVGSFDNISGSFGNDNIYYLHLTIPGARVSCQFENVENDVKRKLDLLRFGDEVHFIGDFTGSTMFESGRWFIENCAFLN